MGKPDNKDPNLEPPNPKYAEGVSSRSGYYDHSSSDKWVRPLGEAKSAKINQTLFDPKKAREEVPFTDNRYNRAKARVLKSALFSRYDGDWGETPWGWVLNVAIWIVLFSPILVFSLFILGAVLSVLMFIHNR
jgi:hypothetical protein